MATRFTRWAAGLEIFLGIGAICGGAALVMAPDGHLLQMPKSTLANSPFSDFLVPGLILFTFVGLLPLAAAFLTLRHSPRAPLAALGVGLVLVGWIVVEMLMLAGPGSLLWSLYLVLGVVIAAIGWSWWRSGPASPRSAR